MRNAVSEKAEQRAEKYNGILGVATSIKDEVLKSKSGLEVDYIALVGKYQQLRDFKEMKHSKHKQKVEINCEFVLKEL